MQPNTGPAKEADARQLHCVIIDLWHYHIGMRQVFALKPHLSGLLNDGIYLDHVLQHAIK